MNKKHYSVKKRGGDYILNEKGEHSRFTLVEAQEINNALNNTATIEKWCPDGGKCHHICKECECFRVHYCAPFSDYNSGEWTEEDKKVNNKPKGYDDDC